MKVKFLLPLVAVLSMLLSSYTTDENTKIYGVWDTPKKDGKVKMYKAKSGKLCGKLSWMEEPNNSDGTPKLDTNNPDKSLREKTVLNTVLFKHFVYKGDNTWEDGTVYDPQNGKTYSCIIKLKDDNSMEVRGFIGISLLGRTETFTRNK